MSVLSGVKLLKQRRPKGSAQGSKMGLHYPILIHNTLYRTEQLQFLHAYMKSDVFYLSHIINSFLRFFSFFVGP